MAAEATTVAIFTPDEWAARLLRLYPNKWTGDSAKAAGGILHSLFKSQSSQYTYLQNGLDYVLKACRIATATDTALDAIAEDFFGRVSKYEPLIVRQPGEPDSNFRKRIFGALLASGGTRADISRVIELLTGKKPRIIEPWNVNDTACCDAITYCDVDTEANPGRVADIAAPYQALVESILPSFGDQGNNPIYCLDQGFSCDRSFIIDPQPTWFMGEKELDLALNRVRMFATIIWRSYFSSAVSNYARGNMQFMAAGAFDLEVDLAPPVESTMVVLACAHWNSIVSAKVFSRKEFKLTCSVPAPPGGKTLDWIAAPITVPGYGVLFLQEGQEIAEIARPATGGWVLATPSWNTSVWVREAQSGSVSFEFSVPAPPGGLLYYGGFAVDFSGETAIAADELTKTVFFNAPIDHVYQLILLPGWQTQFEVVKSNSGFEVTFTTPPPEDSFFYWGVLDQPY